MKVRWTILAALACLVISFASTLMAANNWALKVSSDGRRVQKANGADWIWMGDTAWELFVLLKREEVDKYMANRRDKGFSVIQAIAIGGPGRSTPWNGPNAYGRRPFIDGDVTKPDTNGSNHYWTHADYIINSAERHGLYVALLPLWHENIHKRGVEQYANWIANRYKNRPNIIWVVGGDIHPKDALGTFKVVGRAIARVAPNHLMTYHPRSTASADFKDESWHDINMIQSGHNGKDKRNDDAIEREWNSRPTKPTLDGEPCYEHHQIRGAKGEPIYYVSDVRHRAYWSIFAGGTGMNYGNVYVWAFTDPTKKRYTWTVPRDANNRYWYNEIDTPGAFDMKHVVDLMMSRPHVGRAPDQGILADQLSGAKRLRATRGNGYAFIYTGFGDNIQVNLDRVPGNKKKYWWYNPRDGRATQIQGVPSHGRYTFRPPGNPGRENDWVLVIDDSSKNYSTPGKGRQTTKGSS